MLDLLEVALAQAKHRRPIHLAAAAHVVIRAGSEGLAVFIEPGFLGNIFLIEEDRVNVPVFGFLGQIAAALKDGHAKAMLDETVG